MTGIAQTLATRKENLTNEVAELSKSKFFSMRALFYCISFIKASVAESDIDKFDENFKPNFEEDLPSEWILKRGNDLISDKFDNYDVVASHPQATRVSNYIRSQLFIALMTELEDYFNHLLELVLLAYPGKLQSDHFDVETILQQVNADELIHEKVISKIMSKLYDPPRQFFNFVKNTLDIDNTIETLIKEQGIIGEKEKQAKRDELSLEQFLPDYVEMKSRRDLGIHSGWIRNSFYDERITKYGGTFYQGNFLGVDEDYFRKAVDTAINIVVKCNTFCGLGYGSAN